MHSLAEACRLQYMVTSLLSHHDIAVWDGQRHGVDVVNIVCGPLLVPVSVPGRLQFDRERLCWALRERTCELIVDPESHQRGQGPALPGRAGGYSETR